MANVMEMCEAVKDYVIEMRRELHKIPELGINNPKTKDFICAPRCWPCARTWTPCR